MSYSKFNCVYVSFVLCLKCTDPGDAVLKLSFKYCMKGQELCWRKMMLRVEQPGKWPKGRPKSRFIDVVKEDGSVSKKEAVEGVR